MLSPNAVAANMALTVKAHYDGATSSDTLATITNAAPWSGKNALKIEPVGANGNNDFFLELSWPTTCTAPMPIALPITIDIDVHE